MRRAGGRVVVRGSTWAGRPGGSVHGHAVPFAGRTTPAGTVRGLLRRSRRRRREAGEVRLARPDQYGYRPRSHPSATPGASAFARTRSLQAPLVHWLGMPTDGVLREPRRRPGLVVRTRRLLDAPRATTRGREPRAHQGDVDRRPRSAGPGARGHQSPRRTARAGAAGRTDQTGCTRRSRWTRPGPGPAATHGPPGGSATRCAPRSRSWCCCWSRAWPGWSSSRSPRSAAPARSTAPPPESVRRTSRARRTCWSGRTRAQASSAAEKKRLGTGSVEGQRTDTMMILYVPPGGKPALISIPPRLLRPDPRSRQQQGQRRLLLRRRTAARTDDRAEHRHPDRQVRGDRLRRLRRDRRRRRRGRRVPEDGDQGQELPSRPQGRLSDPGRGQRAGLRPDALRRSPGRPRPGGAATSDRRGDRQEGRHPRRRCSTRSATGSSATPAPPRSRSATRPR